jgi:SAM-dependent methyltransferase
MKIETPWYDDDAFWEAFQPFMFPDELLKRTPAEIDGLESLLHLQSPATILDLGCGVGRHSLELARRGYCLTALDRTAVYLNKTRQDAAAERLTIEIVHGDMRDFVRPGAFDFVINLTTSGLSYFPDFDSDRRVVSNVFASLKPGGRFVVHTKGKEVLARVFQPRDWMEIDGTYFLQQRHVTDNWSWMVNRWILIRHGEVSEYEISHRLYAGAELCRLMTDCGFSQAVAYGDFRGRPYDSAAPDLVVVATK